MIQSFLATFALIITLQASPTSHDKKKLDAEERPNKSETVKTEAPKTKAPKSYCSSCDRDSRGRIERSSTSKREFERSKPCPSTGKSGGNCAGYIIDHVKPLACGGSDSPGNMAWQTTADAKAKDKVERKGCR